MCFPGQPLQWMPLMPPLFGIPPPIFQTPPPKPVGQCVVTKVLADSASVKSPVHDLIAQVDAITPSVRQKSPQSEPKVSSAVATRKRRRSQPIVIEPNEQRKNKTRSTTEGENPSSLCDIQMLRSKITTQHAVLVHDLQALQQLNSNNGSVQKICVDYLTGVSSIETQRSHALIVATDMNNRRSIEFYYDKKRQDLMESTVKTLKKLKSSVKIPAIWSAPGRCLSFVANDCETDSVENIAPAVVDKEPAASTKAKSVEETNAILNQWYEDFRDCPYANNEDVLELSQKTGLTVAQVRKWLGNRRLRDKDSKVRLRKYDSKIILGHLRRRNKQKKRKTSAAAATTRARTM